MDDPLNRELLVVLLLDICHIEHTSMKQDCFSVLISGLGFVSFLKDLCSTLLLTNQPIFGDFTRLSKYMTLGYPNLQHPPQSCWFFVWGCWKTVFHQVHDESERKALEVSEKIPISICWSHFPSSILATGYPSSSPFSRTGPSASSVWSGHRHD